MGYAMSEKVTIQKDDIPFFKVNNTEIENFDNITKVSNNIRSEEDNSQLITTLKKNVQILKEQNEILEIERICLMNENKHLQTRIDDLAKMYPSAVAVLGKTSEFNKIKKNRWFTKKNKI
jgi:hypothetical protein